jgi:amino acid adenylation domain-containing protein
MTDISEINQLAAQKRQLLELLLAEAGIEFSPKLQIVKRSKSENIPLSFAQQRLWFFDQLQPGTSFYNIPAAVRLQGCLQVDALEKSLREIVERHEILRTTFTKVNEEAVQVIHAQPNFQLPIIDLSQLSKTAQEIKVLELAQAEAEYPFDLVNDSLLRIKLLHLHEQEHVLLIVMHHIVADGWSLGVLVRELTSVYAAFSQNRCSPLPELPIQYADFATWQRQYLQGEVLATQLAYWKQQLKGIPPLLQLPTDRPRLPVQSFRGAVHPLALSKAVTAALKDLSQREGVTLFMTLLAAFKTLLYRYTHEHDISVGSPVANRNQVETEHLIGMFVNTLVMRTDVSGNPSFRELLSRVREVALGAFSHQDVPFEKLVEELQPERNLSYSPLFQVTFALQNTSMPALQFVGIELNTFQINNNTAKFDLSLDLSETEDCISGYFEYNTDLFNAETIARMSEHFQTLLEGIIANPDQCLGELPILPARERHQLLVEWNNTTVEYPQNQCIHQLFAAQVEQTPDAVAVVFEDIQLSYQELNAKANQLAHHLQGLGVGPEVLVGIFMERSLEMLVGLLGILKAGGAYVPLDPSYPPQRLQFILNDTQVPVLLTQERLLASLPDHEAQVVCLDRDWTTITSLPAQNLDSGVRSENLAYVIYTSGSTGTPKGVLIPHQAVLRLVLGIDYTPLDSTVVCLQLAPIAFDAATFEIWGTLLHGGSCVLYPTFGIPEPQELQTTLQRYHVTTLWLTAALFNTLITDAPEVLLGVRELLTGGEALSVSHIREAQRQLPGTQLINGYGPTESTTFTCCYRIPQILDRELSSIPIGRPIANTQIYILDAHLQPVPMGVTGELHIGGAGLARGYLNRPELTAEKFIANPFGAGRLYKTGDLTRYLPDGTIEFLGRVDHQVKIRGFRIELGEIEAILGQHPAIQEAVVLVREDHPGEKRLVAYVVTSANSHVSEFRSYLKSKLPDYMMPAAFVMLDSLPLTVNGKVDRRALPLPEIARPDLQVNYVAPRTKLEQEIAKIWQDVLQVEKVGLHDNFFDLGGHSLLVIRIHDRLRDIINQDFSVVEIFKYPTVSSFAHYLSPENSKVLSLSANNNHQFTDIKAGRNRLKQRLTRSSEQRGAK